MEEKLSMESKDILSENVQNIAELFPNTLVESEDGKKIDFDILKQELSKDIVDGSKERYHLDFPGKREAIVEANRKITKTLRPIKEKSVDFDNTKNIYIEGDNLEALKILQESYLGKIKCIYIDPPYNTGNDFVYNDKFSHTTEEELKASGRMDEDGNVLISKDINNDSNGRYHSDWLKMMYSRLKLARNLLSDDGTIFISIDNNEFDNIKKICDEIFGSLNFVSAIPRICSWQRSGQENYMNVSHDYIFCYSRKENFNNVIFRDINNKEVLSDKNGHYIKGDTKAILAARSQGYSKGGDFDFEYNGKIYSPVDSNGIRNRWLWTKERMEAAAKLGILVETSNSLRMQIYIDKRFDENTNTLVDKDIKLILHTADFMEKNFDNPVGTKEVKNIFNGKEFFDNPKPLSLIEHVINLCISNYEKNSIVLDFFSGSATTAHAVMKLNAEDGGNRQFILVQLPEATDEGSESFEAGYKTICDIGEERIRRAGKKIKEESPMTIQNLDTGFRVYKVDSSNMKDIYYIPDKIDQANILDMVSNVKEDRTAEDLLTQVILNLGLPLDLHIEEKMVGNNKLFFVEENALVACFDDTIDLNILDEMAKVTPLKICLRESSFVKDQDKINFFERLKKLSPDTEVSII